PAAHLAVVQRKNNRRGVKNIPPPVEVRPERNPMPAPTGSATPRGAGFTTPLSARLFTQNSRSAEIRSRIPTINLKVWTGSNICPPRKAQGTLSAANGQNARHEKYPARQN